jgi:excisionase family DNA binding protein
MPRALTVKDVAARLGETEDFVRRLIKAGKLRGYRPGGGRAEWRIDDVDLDAHIESWKTQASPKKTAPTRVTKHAYQPPAENIFG